MDAERRGPNINEDDIQAATEKFKEWVTTLPDSEGRVFGWILTRAAAADPGEAARYGLQTGGDIPIQRLMQDAVGLSQGSRDDTGAFMMPDIDPITVWTFRF